METQSLISIDLIDHNPYQPRQAMDPDAVAELADNIKRNTLLQVPTARQVNGHYQLAFGHRRLAAFKFNGEPCMPLIIRELDDLQMFEFGVAENIKRRDLNYVEKAEAMQRYMEEFGMNSVQTAEFFNTTPEDVRGTIRLNNLPTIAKEKLASGKLTVTAARTILSVQKIASAEAIAETLQRIEKGKDRWGNDETPEEAVEEILDLSDEVLKLWNYDGDAKPRGYRNGWLLSTKNFPNKLLPAITPVDAAVALGIQDDEEMMHKVGAWALAAAGARPDLDTESLGIPQELLEKLEHLINPPACNVCPFYSNVNGTHYCGMKICHTRKSYAWEKERLRAAAKDLEIEIYDPEKDGREFRVLEETYSDNGKKHMELFRKRGKDLRIAMAVDIDRKKSQSGYNGVPSSCVVMVVGPTLKKLLESGTQKRTQKRAKEQAAALLQRVREEKCDALEWEVAAHVKTLFDGMNMAALESLWDAPGQYGSNWVINRYTFHNDDKPGKDAGVGDQEVYLRRVIALNMVKKIGGSYRKTMAEYAAHLTEHVKKWNVKLPKSIMKLAGEMDQEIASVTAETAAE